MPQLGFDSLTQFIVTPLDVGDGPTQVSELTSLAECCLRQFGLTHHRRQSFREDYIGVSMPGDCNQSNVGAVAITVMPMAPLLANQDKAMALDDIHKFSKCQS